MRNAAETAHPDQWSLHAQLRACAAAFTFLTRIPAWRVIAHDAADLPGAAAYFPVVGLIVGVAGGLAFTAALLIWPPYLALVASVAFTVWITGAFHEDALADSFDGFGGGRELTKVLEIMKDSRVGSYALVGVLLVIAAKLVALYAIFEAAAVRDPLSNAGRLAVGSALVAAHVLGRWSNVFLLARQPYARVSAPEEQPSAGQAFAGSVTRPRLLFASAATVLILAAVLGWRAIGVAAIAITVVQLAARYFARRIGGVTGDALGAANQLVELAVYLGLAAHW